MVTVGIRSIRIRWVWPPPSDVIQNLILAPQTQVGPLLPLSTTMCFHGDLFNVCILSIVIVKSE